MLAIGTSISSNQLLDNKTQQDINVAGKVSLAHQLEATP